MNEILQNNWSIETLLSMIKSSVHLRQGKITSNFEKTLSNDQLTLAQTTFKDPYILDLASLSFDFTERELEIEIVKNVEKFLVELGAGFAFVGRQYHLAISDRDFYIDLLFYHLKMRCYVVVELKKGEFIPEYAGKMNFYCSAVDDMLKHKDDQPTIGLILCQNNDKIFAEYALKDINKPIGISEYDFTKILPENFKSSFPSIEEIENTFSNLDNSED
jgi:predicted nuclease of restriction endonuclease-like (RecB) superfamily